MQVPQEIGKGNGTEFGMHLELVETGYEDKKVRVKTKEANPAKQVHSPYVQTGLVKLACEQETMKLYSSWHVHLH